MWLGEFLEDFSENSSECLGKNVGDYKFPVLSPRFQQITSLKTLLFLGVCPLFAS